MDEKKLKELEEMVGDFMKFMRSEEYNEDDLEDYKEYIFEAAVEVFEGEEVWKEINEIM